MDIKLSRFTFDITSALVFIFSVAVGLFIAFELIVSYVELFH
jgi:hypothetical protein